ncbi:MAG: helix-turn-helix transcriptional regulator [Methylovulum sp.]|nr:helix-turn-helix transcriptional regulator [Methylovulum sp.]
MKNPDFHRRLTQLIGGESPFTWARRMGISKGAFSRIWNEGSVPGSEHLVSIKNGTGVSLDWLLAGEGDMALYAIKPSVAHQLIEERGLYENDEFTAIPRYNVQAAAGHGAINTIEEQLQPLAFRRDWLIARHLSPADLVVVDVAGNSMEPNLRDGDMVLVDRAQTEVSSGKTYVLRIDGHLLVKNLQLLPQGLIQVCSFNTGFAPYQIDLSNESLDMAVIGRVVASMHEW